MISYIRGPLEEKREDSVVVEAGNIGYRIFIPSSVLGELPGLGEEVKIYTYFSVREDGMSLFGFLSRQDLEMFRQLIGGERGRSEECPGNPLRAETGCAASGCNLR